MKGTKEERVVRGLNSTKKKKRLWRASSNKSDEEQNEIKLTNLKVLFLVAIPSFVTHGHLGDGPGIWTFKELTCPVRKIRNTVDSNSNTCRIVRVA